MQFIAVPDTPYEHATRCVEAVQLCKFALSLDPDAPGASSFIRDVSSRTLKVGKLSESEKAFLSAEMSTNSSTTTSISTPSSAEFDPESSSGSTSGGGAVFIAFAMGYAASYFLLKAMGVESTFWALLFSVILCAPIGGAIALVGILIHVKLSTR